MSSSGTTRTPRRRAAATTVRRSAALYVSDGCSAPWLSCGAASSRSGKAWLSVRCQWSVLSFSAAIPSSIASSAGSGR